MELTIQNPKTEPIRTTMGRVAIEPSGPQKQKILTGLRVGIGNSPYQILKYKKIMAYSTQLSSDTNND
jgi:hypothetical protein